MKRNAVAALFGAALLAGGLALAAPWGTARAAGTGPQFSIANLSVGAGTVSFDVVLGASADPHTGYNLHLRYDPAVFQLNAVADAGLYGGAPFCPAPVEDADTAGFIFACTSLSGSTTSGGTLVNATLDVVAPGCSALDFVAFDGVDTNNGTYTVNAADFTAQSNTYVDATSDETGASCSAAPTATPTQTATPTSTNTPGPTNTSVPVTPSATPPGGLRTVTPTPGPSETPTVAPPTDGQTPGAPAATATRVGTGVGPGSLQPPDTGAGSAASGGSSPTAFAVIAIGAAGMTLLAGGVLARRRWMGR